MTRLLQRSWELYRRCAAALVPLFVAVYIVLRLALPLAVEFDAPADPAVLLVFVVQVVLPAFVGSLLFAFAAVVLWSDCRTRQPRAWAALAPHWQSLVGASSVSVLLAAVATVLLGPVGVLIQPMFLGPPVIVHEIALRHRGLGDAWRHTRRHLRGDARLPVFLLLISCGVGLITLLALNVFGELSGTLFTGVARGTLFFALQGVLIGVTLPYVAAVGLVGYRDISEKTP